VRAVRSADGTSFESGLWPEVSRQYRDLMRMALERKAGRFDKETARARNPDGKVLSAELSMARMLSGRVRYFTAGAVIGSREFVDGFFREARDRFGPKRRSGARKMRGAAAAAAGTLWSARDLRVDVEAG